MKDFFRVVSPAQFRDLLQGFSPSGAETVALQDAFGRCAAADVAASEDLPMLSRSCMDGYAVRARDVFGAGEANPAYLECDVEAAVDKAPETPVEPGRCARIVTGASLPPGADAVVMVEHTQEMGGNTVEMRKAGPPGDNVMLKGEDVRAGETALKKGTLLRAQEIGLLAALGVAEAEVAPKPCAAIISTGDELVPILYRPEPGQVRDVNTYTLKCLIEEAGGYPTVSTLVRDDLKAIEKTLRTALEDNDMVFISGGSSVGARDYTLEAVAGLPDAEILAHGVAVSPGKPTILARVGEKAVWGLPGQVTSAQVVMHVFGMPFVRRMAGDAAAFTRRPPSRRAELARNLPSKQGREDYVRVRFEERDGALPLAHPVLGKSGLLKTLLQADALVRVDADREGLDAGSEVEARLV